MEHVAIPNFCLRKYIRFISLNTKVLRRNDWTSSFKRNVVKKVENYLSSSLRSLYMYVHPHSRLPSRLPKKPSCPLIAKYRSLADRFALRSFEPKREWVGGWKVDGTGGLTKGGCYVGRLNIGPRACHHRVKVIFMRMSQDLYSRGHAEMDSRGYTRRFNTQ